LLTTGILHLTTSPYSSLVLMVLKKEDSWHMFPNFCDLNKITIKQKFPFPIIDDLLDKLIGS
jgi:hypothetical protein